MSIGYLIFFIFYKKRAPSVPRSTAEIHERCSYEASLKLICSFSLDNQRLSVHLNVNRESRGVDYLGFGYYEGVDGTLIVEYLPYRMFCHFYFLKGRVMSHLKPSRTKEIPINIKRSSHHSSEPSFAIIMSVAPKATDISRTSKIKPNIFFILRYSYAYPN